jgi:hypothetical protein
VVAGVARWWRPLARVGGDPARDAARAVGRLVERD